MPLFGNKNKKIDLPEVVDFSNDTWSFKGNPPVYQIQSDGFSYDIVDADGNDKNAISLGIAGMLVIVLNAKSPKIKEDELLPHFGKVIKTRNWHSMTVKEANFLVQTAIKKLTNSATSGDVFDLASYAPLEVKRVLLKTLFTISRTQIPTEYREEAEHRVIDDIVPDIFANPDYELALLTGLIVKSDEKSKEYLSSGLETSPIIENELPFRDSDENSEIPAAPSIPVPEPDSAFAELQKIYGRKIDTPQVRAAASQSVNQNPAANAQPVDSGNISQSNSGAYQSNTPAKSPEPVSIHQEKAPAFSAPQPVNPFASPAANLNQPANMNQQPAQGFSEPVPNNPFVTSEPRSIPQPSAPNFSAPQPNNPFAANQGTVPYPQQNIPQPPAPNNMQQGNFGYGRNFSQYNQQIPNQMNPQGNPYQGNFPPYPPQMWSQNQPGQPNGNPQQNYQMPYPPQNRPQNYPYNPNMPGVYQQNQNFPQNADATKQNSIPGSQNPGQNYPQSSQQDYQNK